MLFGVLVLTAVGLLCVILGLILWRKQKITLLHTYHYQNVRKEDIPAYTRQMGIGLIVIGAGILGDAAANLTGHTAVGFVLLGAGFVAGFIVMSIAQKKYNGSWFS